MQTFSALGFSLLERFTRNRLAWLKQYNSEKNCKTIFEAQRIGALITKDLATSKISKKLGWVPASLSQSLDLYMIDDCEAYYYRDIWPWTQMISHGPEEVVDMLLVPLLASAVKCISSLHTNQYSPSNYYSLEGLEGISDEEVKLELSGRLMTNTVLFYSRCEHVDNLVRISDIIINSAENYYQDVKMEDLLPLGSGDV